MTQKTYTTTFGLNEQVLIKDVEVLGFVDRIELNPFAYQYRVVYWLDGSRHETWMYDHELVKG